MDKTNEFVLEMKNISIEFPGVKALSNVDFTVSAGQRKALIGANGAGKSTLMKVLSGANPTYTGDIFINGEKLEIRDPRQAKNLGIELVYQEVDTALIPYLTVAENIMFNRIVTGMKGKALINWNYMRKSAKEILQRLNMNINVNTLVQDLTLAQKQMVLIARAVRENCRLLILDEPTAPLSMGEVKELFRIIRDLSDRDGVAIVFISHRIPELFEICQKVSVMKDGFMVANFDVDENLTQQQVVNTMLGRSFEENFPKRIVPIKDVTFEVEHLQDEDGKVNDVSFYARGGEIVGISGLVGAGKTELSKLLFGATKKKSGTVKLHGKDLNIRNTTQAVKNRISLVPEERRKEGVLVDEPVYFNLSAACLDRFCHLSFVNKKAELENARKYIKDLKIKTPSEHQKVKLLSGGNQQKVVVGKWLSSDADIYIMDEPTKGVDVGSKHEIFELIETLAEAGKTIIYASSEITEILAITDRTYVMYSGEIMAELKTSETTEEEILYYSTGGKQNEQHVG